MKRRQKLGIALFCHRSRSADEMRDWGGDHCQRDLIIAHSPASWRMALELTRFHHPKAEYWRIIDPTGLGEVRKAKVKNHAHDQIPDRILARIEELTATGAFVPIRLLSRPYVP